MFGKKSKAKTTVSKTYATVQSVGNEIKLQHQPGSIQHNNVLLLYDAVA